MVFNIFLIVLFNNSFSIAQLSIGSTIIKLNYDILNNSTFLNFFFVKTFSLQLRKIKKNLSRIGPAEIYIFGSIYIYIYIYIYI
jgi:hypothetical protein